MPDLVPVSMQDLVHCGQPGLPQREVAHQGNGQQSKGPPPNPQHCDWAGLLLQNLGSPANASAGIPFFASDEMSIIKGHIHDSAFGEIAGTARRTPWYVWRDK